MLKKLSTISILFAILSFASGGEAQLFSDNDCVIHNGFTFWPTCKDREKDVIRHYVRNPQYTTTVSIGLIGWYKFDYLRGNSIFDSIDAYNGTVTVTGGTATMSAGKINGSLRMTTTTKMENGDLAAYDFENTPYSISVWVYPYSFANGYDYLVFNYSANNGYSIQFGTTGTLYFIWGDGGTSKNSAFGLVLTLNTWTHLAVTNNEGTPGDENLRVYVNGAQTGTTSLTGFNVGTSTNTGMSGLNNHATNKTNCNVDDLRYYNRKLTNHEILTIYQEYAGTEMSSQPYIPVVRMDGGK